MDTNLKLWYEQPARSWEEALPIGNGHLGAMVFGEAAHERIQLNEDTLWSGFPRDNNNYEALIHLQEARRLLGKRKYAEAEALVRSRMLGPWTESYEPLADLWLDSEHESVEYGTRSLRLDTATASTSYRADGVEYSRECYISEPDLIQVIRLRASRPGALSLKVRLSSPHPFRFTREEGGMLALQGRAPTHAEPDYVKDHPNPVLYEEERGLLFEVRLRTALSGGQVTFGDAKLPELIVEGADSLTLLVSAATGFNGYKGDPYEREPDISRLTREAIDAALERTEDELRERHIREHRRLFNRLTLSLGEAAVKAEILPTDKRLEAVRQGADDPGFAALYLQYGRYLLLSSSRPGTQPANLQGIWNERVQPPWSSNYTTNINVQMNYWLAETGNLSECHEPLLRMVGELCDTGARTARIHYNCGGWTTHHNVDLWRSTNPASGEPLWSFWPLGGAWLAAHMWEHYVFTGDEAFLRERAYPALKGAAEFVLDWLVEDEQGCLTTNPSTSPENYFKTPEGTVSSTSVSSTMDRSIIRVLFRQCFQAAKILGTDEPFIRRLIAAEAKLHPFSVGRHGQLQEWLEDFEEHEPGHRHWSHLYGLYPGNLFTSRDTPDLLSAARRSVERRLEHGGGEAGWSAAWAINLWARLGEGARAYSALRAIWSRSTHSSLLNVHPPYQIDGNLGAAAGILEMLIQSHEPTIRLLPALPTAWSEGEIRGVRARGGFEWEIRWKEGKLLCAKVHSLLGGECRIAEAEGLDVDAPGAYRQEETLIFPTRAGEVYSLLADRDETKAGGGDK